MNFSSRLSSCSGNYCPSGAALRAGKAQQPPIDLAAAYPERHDAVFPQVDFRPAGIFRRQIAAWRGLGGEFTPQSGGKPKDRRDCPGAVSTERNAARIWEA